MDEGREDQMSEPISAGQAAFEQFTRGMGGAQTWSELPELAHKAWEIAAAAAIKCVANNGQTGAHMINVEALVNRDGEGLVNVTLNETPLLQMDVQKAFEVAGMINRVAGVAESEQTFWRWMKSSLNARPEMAATALSDFRDIRQEVEQERNSRV
jgi:hypothetical protein